MSDSSGEGYRVHKVEDHSFSPIEMQMVVNRHTLTMELATGAAVSVISDKMRREFFPTEKLHKSTSDVENVYRRAHERCVFYEHVSYTVNKRQILC